MGEVWPRFGDLIQGGNRTPLGNNRLPDWAEPTDREENYHHALRRLIETSDWEALSTFGPEANLGALNIDVLVDLSPIEGALAGVDERIGIEVKESPDAFERKTSNLEQVVEQARSGLFDRLYICTPDSNVETRLDIDPERSGLINLLDLAESSIAFRGVTGKIRGADGTKLPKPAYYTQLLNEDKEKLFEVLRSEGDLERVQQNLKNNDYASFEFDDRERKDEWIDPILKKVGIIRFDEGRGTVRVQREAEFLNTTDSDWSRQGTDEADVVHAVWEHYLVKQNVDVSVEVEPPSLETIDEPDMIQRFLGERTIRYAPRIDLLVADGDWTIGIEAKGPDPDWNRLIEGQLPVYRSASELDELLVAVPEDEADTARRRLAEEFPSVGLLACADVRTDPRIDRVR